MEDDLNSFENGRQHQIMENEREPQFFKMEDDLNSFSKINLASLRIIIS
jgi:hypothetical protein